LRDNQDNNNNNKDKGGTNYKNNKSRTPDKPETNSAPPQSGNKSAGTPAPNVRLCWNCGESDHNFSACKKPKLKFCHRCGKKNVISKQCCALKNPQGAVLIVLEGLAVQLMVFFNLTN
jgi:hypothetical protein